MTDYRKRLERLQADMDERNLDLLVLGASPDFQYVTGINVNWRSGRDLSYPADSVFVPREGEPVVMVGMGNSGTVKDSWIRDCRSLGFFEDMRPTVKKIMGGFDAKKIGIGEYTWGTLVLAVATNAEAKFQSAEGILDKQRMIKDSTEITKLRNVAKLTEEVMVQIIDELDEGISMHELTSKIRHLGRLNGATDISFPPTGGFCKSGSEPVGVFNYEPDQPLEPGTAIAFDIGFVMDGYCSDWGRSLYLGKPAEHIEKAYPALMTAVVETIDEMGGEVQRTDQIFDHIEKVCDREGYGDRLRERLPQRMVGHQIGVEVHEDPWLRPDQRQELVDGMVFCIEPKLWHKGEYYLRVEDMVLIKNGKAESLTTYDRELFQL
jgi:Xaa-Pro aminopeptidase